MKTYQLKCGSFIDPLWFNRVRHGQYEAIVSADGTIELEGETLRFTNNDELPPDTHVKVWLNRNFECATMEDIKERDRQHQLRREADERAYRDKLNWRRDEAIAFNSTIKLPVKWDIGEKLVISSLLENSWGDGHNKATVQHIVLLEDLNIGRLKRNKGEFLCSKSIGKFNTFHEFQQYEGIRFTDGDGKKYQPKITCKQCLKVLERLNNKQQLRR